MPPALYTWACGCVNSGGVQVIDNGHVLRRPGRGACMCLSEETASSGRLGGGSLGPNCAICRPIHLIAELPAVFGDLYVREVTNETSGRWAILLITCAVRGVNPALDSRLVTGCLVQRTARAATSSTRWLFTSRQVGARGAPPIEPCMRRLGELTGRWPDPCPSGLLVFVQCNISGTFDEMQGLPRPVGP